MYKSLSDFISALDAAGELIRVRVPVDPVLEIAEITDRVSKSPGGGKALLFEETGTGFPVLTNMTGSDRRMAIALGADSLEEIARRIDSIAGRVLSPKESFSDKAKMLPLAGEVSRWLPRTSRRRGECQRTVLRGHDAALSLLPVLKCWPCDGGRFVTLPLVHTIDPDTGNRNVGMYRMQITGQHTTGMHWHMHKTGERHYRAYKRRGERMPVSVCLGGDPAYTYCATAPLPDNVDEYLLAGFLRRRPVKLVKCMTNDLYVPSDCDFVIEGYVDPAEEKFCEGPFGDHTGFYSLEDDYPTFHVTAITHRRGAVYPATVVGIPPQEDLYISKATETIFLAPIRAVIQPEITDLYMPAAGVAHNLTLIAAGISYPGQAFNKIMLVCGDGDDIRTPQAVARRLRNADLREDAMFSRGVLDVLDHATATPGTGGKLAIDLTAERGDKSPRVPEEPDYPQWVASADMSLVRDWGIAILRCVKGSELRAGAGAGTSAGTGLRVDAGDFLRRNGIRQLNFLILADAATETLDYAELLWIASGNTDPGRDMWFEGETLVIDARSKTPYREGYPARWPNVVAAAPGTIALVDARWREYGIGDFLPSPSLRYSPLVSGEKAGIPR